MGLQTILYASPQEEWKRQEEKKIIQVGYH